MLDSVSLWIHLWSECHGCGVRPISGIRYECLECPVGPDIDLCEKCYYLYKDGKQIHPKNPTDADWKRRQHSFRAQQGRPASCYERWTRIADSPAVAPPIHDRFLLRPEFRVGPESFLGTYGFALDTGSRAIVLTALHVLDEVMVRHGIDASHENSQYTGRELPLILDQTTFYDAFATRWVFAELARSSRMLCLPEARTRVPEPDSYLDIAGFEVNQSNGLEPARLAPNPPAVGEAIWLVANPGKGSQARTFAAVIVESNETRLVFRFAGPTHLPRGTSGAPLVNRMGEVVGINSGGGTLDGQHFGHATPLSAIERHLRTTVLNLNSDG